MGVDEQPKKPGFFEKLKERRALWREAKRDHIRELKERYQYAPLVVRLWHLYLKWPVTLLAILTLAVYVFFPAAVLTVKSAMNTVLESIYAARNTSVDQATIYEMAPIDEEGAARIAALDPIDKDDTWTICVYMVGADLEDAGENDLSEATRLKVQQMVAERPASDLPPTMARVQQYIDELEANGLDLPSYMYNPTKPVASSRPVTQDVVVATRPGAASTDIGEMTSGVWSDNIRIVIQTGGATRWSNSMVNPNRTQRFLYEKGKFKEIENLPLQPSSVPETLAEFLTYCRDNYAADHTMLVLWNHGSGAFGYGADSIFEDVFSIADIRSALASAYEPNLENPPFDIIGFDACLMSSLEVTHLLDGYAKYYAVSEEVEPGDGWDYGPWLQAMTDDPTMSPARVCQAIADSYTDFYMTQNANISFIIDLDTTFAVLDAAKAHELYDAYSELCKAQLIDAASDLSVLSEMGRAANRTTHYAGSDASIFNTIDLGGYVDNLVDFYPEECSKVKQLVGETVLYHRDYGTTSDSQGISVYLPAKMDSLYSFVYAIKYLTEPCEDQNTAALYYYKISGALNEELGQYVSELSGVEPKKLNTELLNAYSKTVPEATETGFSIAVDSEVQGMMQDYAFEFAAYNEDNDTLTYYGRDEYVTFENDEQLHVDFDGEWICLGDVPLAVEILSTSPSSIEYRSKVDCGGTTKYLEISYDIDSETFNISGIREMPSGLLGGDGSANSNNFIGTRTLKQLNEGDIITPIYTVYHRNDSSMTEEKSSKSVMIKPSTEVQLKKLPNGYYVGSAVITDQRGDDYYSPVMGYTIAGGGIADHQVDDDFYASSW